MNPEDEDSPDTPDEPRTVFIPVPGTLPEPEPDTRATTAPPPPAPDSSTAGTERGSTPERTYTPMAPRTGGSAIQVGDVLNHIFEVKRFIARGGMGEVFEGVNVSSDERVAIKVMLPALAADSNVQAMFRKEARTLTRLAHPALVQYRVLAQEPQLGVLYIVTEFVDGTNLSNVLGAIKPGEPELRALARRLAEGLRAAHALGAIHRDISPDNVLLEDGRLEGAKIIDFGIAKDLGAGNMTIVGDGFAGKLNYVAPEQLGDFGREVGPWSDVYSLGLVLLAIARGKDVDMGATLVDAVDRRRAGPDVSSIPEALRSAVAAMLVPDPALRLRSMEAVIAMLDGAPPSVAPPTERLAKPVEPAKLAGPTIGARRAMLVKAVRGLDRRQLLLAGGGGTGLLVIVLAFWLASGSGTKPVTATSGAETPAGPVAQVLPLADRARVVIEQALPGIACSWLDIGSVSEEAAGVSVSMRGAARDSADAQGAIARALSQAGIAATAIEFDQVAQATPQMCSPLDAFRPLRLARASGLSVRQTKFELETDPDGESLANALIDIDLGPASQEIAVLGMEPNGTIEAPAHVGRAKFVALATDPIYARTFTKTGEATYRATLTTSHTGLSAVLLLTARDPFTATDEALLVQSPETRGPKWARQMAEAAERGAWHAQMVWYRTVDEIPG